LNRATVVTGYCARATNREDERGGKERSRGWGAGVGWAGMKSSRLGSRHGWPTAAGAAREHAAVAAAMEDLAGEGRIDGKTVKR